ncbi:MORN repeat-containing protein [Croceitalea rosinachiae]|uniref:MORN repeat-containing protein n=1 Tax=Croceitalea rosinachiae TaxID=3075596 RepID=A0ABU3ACI8_9FLAO|nr:hypothetical protein [Croceitalea sp. F388]MDT0607590.1 hypothetical protein [Croceitalea sp. F388]
MKKRIIIPYLLLGAALIIALGLFFRTNKLQRQLHEFNANQTDLAKTVATYEDLVSKDSLLLSGDYHTAIQAYHKIAKEIGSDSMGVKLRIALAQKIKTYSEERLASLQDTIENDSSNIHEAISPIEIRRYDSLNFAHEKAKIQLGRLRKQLQEKSFGEYLTFKSKKGNQMHYVGRVRNNKANGFGIALLDTGSRYEGEWLNNERHGQGTFYWPDGEYYVGSYSHAKRNGLGTYYWPNGEKYIGFWKDDRRNGQGEFYAADGTVLTSGLWKNDELVETDKKDKKTRR